MIANNSAYCMGLTWELLSEGVVKCSLRSVDGVDISDIAKRFGGGGHKNAAGFVLTGRAAESLMSYQELRTP
jgi:nanoRNase/pAp phosphatase (c-di-AMP/oligoRNAs hydrolase)